MNATSSSAPQCISTGFHARPVLLALLLALPSAGFVQKYAGLAGVAGYVVLVTAAVFLVRFLGGRLAPWLDRNFRVLAALSITGLLLGFVVLHPFEDGRGPGKSSDRDEGLEFAVTRLAHGQTPYYPSNRLAGPLSVLPGSMLLASPFVALGNSGYQNVFWLAAFLLAAAWLFENRALALLLLVVPLGVSVAAQYEFVSGGDLIANGIFVVLFFLIALKTWQRPTAAPWHRWLACVLLGVGLASRANFILLLPLFGGAVWRMAGLRHAIMAAAIVAVTIVLLTVPIYLHDPGGFTPLMTKQKLAMVDHVLPWASKAMIGATMLASLLAALVLLRSDSRDPLPLFFRCCTWVTLTPILCAVSFSSWISGQLDFAFLRDRFGLMFLFFSLLGWGRHLLPATVTD